MNRTTQFRPADVPAADPVLTDPRCRRVVAVLAEREAAVSLSELATAVGARAVDGRAGDDDVVDAENVQVPEDVIDDVRIALHHAHLPKLDRANVVDYDARTKTVIPERVQTFAPAAVDSHDGDA